MGKFCITAAQTHNHFLNDVYVLAKNLITCSLTRKILRKNPGALMSFAKMNVFRL
jgi:hypothetical protein